MVRWRRVMRGSKSLRWLRRRAGSKLARCARRGRLNFGLPDHAVSAIGYSETAGESSLAFSTPACLSNATALLQRNHLFMKADKFRSCCCDAQYILAGMSISRKFDEIPMVRPIWRVSLPHVADLFLLRCGISAGILLQRVIADFLFAMPLPFLGVSSLNLAASAPRKRPFFYEPAEDLKITPPPRADRASGAAMPDRSPSVRPKLLRRARAHRRNAGRERCALHRDKKRG